MGFLSRVKDFFSGNSSEQKGIIESYKAEFLRYDNGHLRQILRTAVSGEVREAAASVLRERGEPIDKKS